MTKHANSVTQHFNNFGHIGSVATQTASIKDRVLAYALADIPVILRGPAGVGKTAIVREVARTLGYECVEIHLAQFESVDLKGVPSIDKNTTFWNAPTFMKPTNGKPFVLFLDELGNAEPDVIKAAYQLILDRRVGDCSLPKGTVIIAASNRKIDAPFVKELPKPVNNRMAHIDFDVVSKKEWTTWAAADGIHPMIIGFMDFAGDTYLHKDPQHASGKGATSAAVQYAFPTPRSWEMVSRYMHACDRFYSGKYNTEIIGGIVGDATASAFAGFYRVYKDLPSWADVEKDPSKVLPAIANKPNAVELRFAFASMLFSNATSQNLDAVFTAMDKNLMVEHQAMVVARLRDNFARDPKTQTAWATNKNVTKWLATNSRALA